MSDNLTQMHPVTSFDASGVDRILDLFREPDRSTPFWNEMLAIVGGRNAELHGILEHRLPRRTASRGASVVAELERERARMARELHSGAGQPLAAIRLNLEMLEGLSATLPPAGREVLTRLETLVDQALEQVRALSHRLHPPEWQCLDTPEALRRLVWSTGLADRIHVQLEVPQLMSDPPHPVKIAIYRCAQECLANILRHSGADRVSVSLRPRNAFLELEISDNGRGIGPEASAGDGIGLAALHEYAALVGASCQIRSGGEGTTVTVRLPVDSEQAPCGKRVHQE